MSTPPQLNKSQILALLISCSAFLLQFLNHGRVGDDWPNSQRYNWIVFRYGHLSLESFLNEIQFGINSWVKGQGRFFPINVITEGLYFTFFRTDLAQNIVHLAIYILYLIIWSGIIWRLFPSKFFIIGFAVSTFSVTRFRWDFDPHIGFGNLLPLTLIFVGLTIHLNWIASNSQNMFLKFFYSLSAAVSFLFSLMTYELAIYLLIGTLLLSIYGPGNFHNSSSFKKRFILIVPTLITSLGYLYFVLVILRSKVNATGAYVTGFDWIQSSRVFLINFIAPFPIITSKIREWFLLPDSKYAIFAIILFSITIWQVRNYLLGYIRRIVEKRKPIFDQNNKVNANSTRSLLLLSISMICGPAFMIAIQPIWWDRIKWGNSYLGVFIQELGVSILIILTIYAILENLVRKVNLGKFDSQLIQKSRNKTKFHSMTKSNLDFALVILLTFLTFASCINMINNFRLVEGTHNRKVYTKVWQGLINSGIFFDSVEDKDIFISETFNDAYDINAGDLFARTGIRLAGMVPPSYLWSNYEGCRGVKSKECELIDVKRRSQEVISNGSREIFTVNKENSLMNKIAIQQIIDIYNKVFKKNNNLNNYSLQDWPTEMSKPEALKLSKVWYFNLFLLTPEVGVAYLFPTNSNGKWQLEPERGVKIYQVATSKNALFNLKLNDICLPNLKEKMEVTTEHGSVFISSSSLESNNEKIEFIRDPRTLQWGTC